MHSKSRVFSPSPIQSIKYIDVQNQDFGSAVEAIDKEVDEQTIQFDEFAKGVDTSNIFVVWNSKANISELSTMIKPKYTPVETKKIDFKTNEIKVKTVIRTHRGILSKYPRHIEK